MTKRKNYLQDNKTKQIIKNTIEFENLGHSQKLKRFKNLHKNKRYIEDENTLRYEGELCDKNKALSKHFGKICGPIPDPSIHTNPDINKINEFNCNLDSYIPNNIHFTAERPPKENNPNTETDDNITIPALDHLDSNLQIINDNYIPKYYDPQFKHNNIDNINELHNLESNEIKNNNDTAKYNAIDTAIKLSNTNSAPGYDAIKSIHLKTNSHVINQLISILFNTWNDSYTIPYYIRLGAIIALLKKDNGDTPNDYRPITLLPLIFKIYERLILWQMNIHHKFRDSLHPLQGGNRSLRGVPEQLGTLNIICERAKLSDIPLFCASLDIKKAFDTVWRKGMFYKLHTKFNLPINLCKIIKGIYENSHSAIRDIPFINNKFILHNGVLQGSVLSPVLFASFIDDMIHELQKSNKGAVSPDPNEKIACIFYCDDVILLANSINDLSVLLKICEDHSKKWAYKFNEDKCKLIFYNDHTMFDDKYNEYSQEQINKINFEYTMKTLCDKPAPVWLTDKPVDNEIYGIDIYGDERIYNILDLHHSTRKPFQNHCNNYNDISDKPFPILYNNTIYDERWSLSMAYHKLKINNKPLQITTKLRYLGAQLCTFDKYNIVSTYYTNKHFLKKLDTKTQMLSKIDFNYNFISLDSKLRTVKAFYLVMTEIFAQILDMRNINLDEAYDKQLNVISNYTDIKRFIPDQMAIYTGIPSPKHRWESIKISFLYKLLKHKSLSAMHKWTNLPYIYHYTIYKQYRDIKQKYFPPQIEITDEELKWEDPFQTVNNVQQLRPLIVLQQHKNIINNLHKLHPFKTLEYYNNDYRSMNTYEHEQLEPYVNRAMMLKYRRLFYNFGQYHNYCKCCFSYTQNPLEYHLIVACKAINDLRKRYWNHAKFQFAKTGAQINKIHSQIFMQKLIEFCTNINTNLNTFWLIICGANDYDNDNRKFIYRKNKININLRKYTLLRQLISLVHKWIHYVFRLQYWDITKKHLLSQHSFQFDYELIFHIRNDTYFEWLQYKYKLRDTDLIFSTDSSRDHALKTTGIGIFIKDYHKFHAFAQPIGDQDNHFGELFAIYKIQFLIEHLNINITNRRIIIFTDSLSNFTQIITTPKKKEIKYHEIHHNTQTYILNNQIILWKVKSHTKPIQQPFNAIADRLANYGRCHPENNNLIIPQLNSMHLATLRGAYSPYGRNVSTLCLPGKLKLSGNLEFGLRPD